MWHSNASQVTQRLRRWLTWSRWVILMYLKALWRNSELIRSLFSLSVWSIWALNTEKLKKSEFSAAEHLLNCYFLPSSRPIELKQLPDWPNNRQTNTLNRQQLIISYSIKSFFKHQSTKHTDCSPVLASLSRESATFGCLTSCQTNQHMLKTFIQVWLTFFAIFWHFNKTIIVEYLKW